MVSAASATMRMIIIAARGSGGDGLGAVFTCSDENIWGRREGEGSDSGPHSRDIFVLKPSVCNV